MGKAKGSLVPIRGSVEDWGPGRHQRNLERKDVYARRMQEQVAKGPPDFDKLLSAGVTPEKKERVKKERTKKKSKAAKKKKARKSSAKKPKKRTTKGRR
jgi:hypothetical protein